MRALVTGVNGFVGRHLARHLLESGWEVWGASLHLAEGPPGVKVLALDLSQPDAVLSAFEQAKPDFVFHLAAQAAVAASHQQPWRTISANVGMQTHVLETLRQHLPGTATLVVGSGDEYGLAQVADLPLREDAPLRPLSPYAVSKVAQDYLGLQYALAYGVHTVRVRPFNHIGPGQGLGFVAADFAHQLALAEAGREPPVIRVGNLSAQRDFTDVRDVVCAYGALAQAALEDRLPWGEVYNVASGRAVAISDLVEMLLHECRVKVEVVVAPERLRPADVPVFVGSSDKLRQAVGWEPRVPLEQTVRDVMNYWRQVVAGAISES